MTNESMVEMGHGSSGGLIPPERDFEQTRSKVKLTRNAKGDAQWEITVVVGDSERDVDRAREIAMNQWRELHSQLGRPTNAASL